MKRAIVFGAAGFIGNHLVEKLKQKGYWVKGVDVVLPKFNKSLADEFIKGDLKNYDFVENVIPEGIDELYQLAADMGGAGYVFTGINDANIMHNSALVNLNTVNACVKKNVGKVFYSSSACIYPQHNQIDPNNPFCEESSAYPADPDSEYGWEKLFSERLFDAYRKNYQLNCKVARFHNVYGPLSIFDGGKEKAPAAICRKVALAKEGGTIEIWGDGNQTRSFLYVDDCLNAIALFMDKDNLHGPINIGSTELVSINDLAQMAIKISGKNLRLKHIDGPIGVMGRCSHNSLIEKELNWKTKIHLESGIEKLYYWINKELN